MINIIDKHKCCGCSACQQVCPKQCISLNEDEEGFLYPLVDGTICIECGLCEKVCPVLNKFDSARQPKSFACKSNDDGIRLSSSSGGMFTLLATKVIEDGGVVFGAKFAADWSVMHDYTETPEGLKAFRGSKYVQSHLGDSFKEVKVFLNSGRTVLFSGTPCQVAGLNHFLRKKYDNLITVDMVCHSIAGPRVWRLYLDEIRGKSTITKITFRDKSIGWHNYALKICGKDFEGKEVILDHGAQVQNPFMRGFLEDLTSRPSCANCPARNYVSGSDITLADFWHLDKYHPEWDDNKGMSLALILTEKGERLLKSCNSLDFCKEVPYYEVEEKGVHSPLTRSTPAHPYREYFFTNYHNNPIIELINLCLKKNDQKKMRVKRVRHFLEIMGVNKVYRICRKIIKR